MPKATTFYLDIYYPSKNVFHKSNISIFCNIIIRKNIKILRHILNNKNFENNANKKKSHFSAISMTIFSVFFIALSRKKILRDKRAIRIFSSKADKFVYRAKREIFFAR